MFGFHRVAQVRSIPAKVYAFILLFVAIECLLLWLGFWQLRRAAEKELMLARSNQAVFIDAESLSAKDGDLIRLTGKFDSHHQFLLDNQTVEGISGYDVVTPFYSDFVPRIYFVNRGWVSGGNDRESLPVVPPPTGSLTLTVRAYEPDKTPFRLSDNQFPTGAWPKRIQYFSSDFLKQQLGERAAGHVVFPQELRLEEGENGVLTRHWRGANIMPPAKHYGYAAQWFLMAITLPILCFLFIRKSGRS